MLNVTALSSFRIKLEDDKPPVYIKAGDGFSVADKLGEELFDAGLVSLSNAVDEGQDALSIALERELAEFQIPELETMTISELKTFAEDEGVNISEATRKADIINTLKAALTDGAQT